MKFLRMTKVLVGTLALAIVLPVMAMNLQQAMSELGSAKDKGVVGEQPNGYLGVVSSGSAEAAEIVKLINDARRAEYQRLAQSNGISLADVEAMAGQKAIERTNSNHFIQVNGKWAKKP